MVMRGLPVLIVLLIFAFVVVPAVRNYLADNLGIELAIRGSSVESAIIALAFTYGAFLSETFRAGIQSIGKGQVEAARSLGMNYWQTMRYIVLPQAIRRVLPPLGNDFVAIVKDSSLVAILGIRDLTQLAKVSSGASFRYLETYLTVAFIYLSMTIIGAVIVRYIERRFSVDNA
jgi:polar amino acid transport system permease protein